jgi:hypothetical protein
LTRAAAAKTHKNLNKLKIGPPIRKKEVSAKKVVFVEAESRESPIKEQTKATYPKE